MLFQSQIQDLLKTKLIRTHSTKKKRVQGPSIGVLLSRPSLQPPPHRILCFFLQSELHLVSFPWCLLSVCLSLLKLVHSFLSAVRWKSDPLFLACSSFVV